MSYDVYVFVQHVWGFAPEFIVIAINMVTYINRIIDITINFILMQPQTCILYIRKYTPIKQKNPRYGYEIL